jgi:hypothetical protein
MLLPLLPVVGTDMCVQTVSRLELFLAEAARVARCLNVSLHMFLHVLPRVVAVATHLTHESPFRRSPY